MDIREEVYASKKTPHTMGTGNGIGIGSFDSFRLSAGDLTAYPGLRKPFTSLPTAAAAAATEKAAAAETAKEA